MHFVGRVPEQLEVGAASVCDSGLRSHWLGACSTGTGSGYDPAIAGENMERRVTVGRWFSTWLLIGGSSCTSVGPGNNGAFGDDGESHGAREEPTDDGHSSST